MTRDLDPIRADGRWFRDAQGRVRLFHGVNVSGRAKMPPFLAFDPEPRHLDPLARWGFNLARLVLVWEGVEPVRGRIDENYLDRAVALGRALAARGLHLIVDLHQDIFSRAYGGSGAPSWALPPVDRDAPGWLRGKRWFFCYFLAPGVIAAERDFWRNARGIQDRFLAALARVAERFREVPGVIGYDVLNEPMGPPSSVFSGRFEREVLPEFQARAVTAVRGGDPERIVFVQPAPLLLGQRVRLGAVPGAAIGFAPHIYDLLSIGSGRYLGWKRSTFGPTARAIARFSEERGWPAVIGEFGALNHVKDAPRMLEDQCRALDRHWLSWAAWSYDPVGPDWNDEGASLVDVGGTERPWLDPLVRPYPRAIAGTPISSRFDREARRYELRYTPGGAGIAEHAATEVFVPRARLWSDSFRVDAAGAEHTWDDVAQVLALRAQPGAAEVRVAIEA